jgi:hypothetical protein
VITERGLGSCVSNLSYNPLPFWVAEHLRDNLFGARLDPMIIDQLNELVDQALQDFEQDA